MSLPHFFLDNQVIADEAESVFPLRLSRDDVKHAKALRLNAGEHVAVVDAVNDYFEVEVAEVTPDGLMVRVCQHLEAAQRPQVLLLQGLAKGEKMDSVVRQATEVGVAGIVPLKCSRSIVKLDQKKAAARTERWRSIAKSAAMQSGRGDVPEVSEPLTVQEAANFLPGATAVLVCWEEAPLSASFGKAIQAALTKTATPALDARVAVVIGPEGGLAAEEVETFLSCNEQSFAVSLGPSILRTETAGVLAPALVLYELEAR